MSVAVGDKQGENESAVDGRGYKTGAEGESQ